MTTLPFRLHGAGVLAPGLTSLSSLRECCLHQTSIDPLSTFDLQAPDRLPSNERRRATRAVRLVLACVEQLCREGAYDMANVRSVFATDDGIGEVSQQMLEAVSTTGQVSPIIFPNSVHGAAAGYFSIAFQNRKSATTVSQGVESFAAGLLTAVIEATTLNEPVLLVAYDAAMTAPMDEVLPIMCPTATAWLISPCSSSAPVGLADFELTVQPAEALPVATLPAWIPRHWHANSSVRGFAALSLLDSGPGASCRIALGDYSLSMQAIRNGVDNG